MSTASRLLRTPISKLLRGRIEPTPSVAELLAASDLPDELRGVVSRVVRRARLKRRERADVAAELIAHFSDALAADETPADAVASFGDERTAAKLIRRAVIRKRPLTWHAFRAVRYTAGVFVLVYFGAGLYFLAGRPTPSVDYVARINAPALAIAESDRAWPVYRAFYLDPARNAERGDSPTVDLSVGPTSPKFPALAQHLRARRAELDALRAATTRPLGFVLGKDNLDPALLALTHHPGQPEIDPTRLSPDSLFDQLIAYPHLGVYRHAANVLAADLTLAAHERDFPRAFDTLDALLALSRQVGTQPLLIDRLVTIGIRSLTVDRAARLLHDYGPDLPADRLRAFATTLSLERSAADLLSFEGERALFYDVVQHTYTDDGNGSGRVTPAMLQTLARPQLLTGLDQPAGPSTATQFLSGGAALAISASRRELLATYDRLIGLQENALRQDPWLESFAAIDAEIVILKQSPRDMFRYMLITVLMPAYTRVSVTAHRALGQSDGLRLAIALELYRRDHNAYPPTLAPLVPAYLPEIPKDRITGDPLRYLLRDGQPVIYSVGVDRTDDTGTPATDRRGRPDPLAAADWPTPATIPPRLKGDWLLYPPTSKDQDEPTP